MENGEWEMGGEAWSEMEDGKWKMGGEAWGWKWGMGNGWRNVATSLWRFQKFFSGVNWLALVQKPWLTVDITLDVYL